MEKNKKRLIVLPYVIYVLYSIAVVVSAVSFHWPQWMITTIVFGMIICVGINFFHDVGVGAKRNCLVFMVWMNMILFIWFDESIVRTIPTMMAFIIMFSVFDKNKILHFSIAASLLCIIMDVLLIRGDDFANFENSVQNIEVFLPVLFVEFVELYQLNQRNRKKIELDRTIENLQMAERGKMDFMANISHEIRTPLNTIYGLGTILQEKNLPDEVHDDIYEINIASRHLMTLVSDILDFTEVENDSVEVVEEPYNLTSVINDVLNMAEAWNAEKGLTLIVDMDVSTPCSILGDGQKLYRVLLNVMNNAIKFTEEGGVRLSVRARWEEYGVNLCIEIQDTGIGIKEEGIENLGNTYNQINTKRDRRYNGIGLGIAISRNLVAKMNGFMNIQSVYGEGTTVSIIIPQKVASNQPIASLNKQDERKVLCYLELEKYENALVRNWYIENLDHMMDGLDVTYKHCSTFQEVVHRLKRDQYEYLFTAKKEYLEQKQYFDSISDQIKVVVFADDLDLASQTEEILVLPHTLRLSSIVAVFNGDKVLPSQGKVNQRKENMYMPTAKVLAVDDVMMNLKVLSALLKKYKISLDTASSGKEAIQKVKAEYYDLIFMDHMMPEMDGVETLHNIRSIPGEYYRAVPIVALTANAVGGAREMFIREGFDDFVAKPIEHNSMERVLTKYLEEKIEHGEVTESDRNHAPERPINTEKSSVEESSPVTDIRERLDAIDDIDVDAGMTFCGEKMEDYLDILKGFIDSMHHKGKEIEDTYQQEKWEEYTILVHSVKGMAATVGAQKVSDLAKELQVASQQKNMTILQKQNAPFLEKLYGLVKDLEDAFGMERASGEENEPKETSTTALELQPLKEAIRTFNQTRTLEVLDMLEAQQSKEEAFEHMAKVLRQAMDQFDFMKAQDILSRYEEGESYE